MDATDDAGLCQGEQVVVAGLLMAEIGEARAVIVGPRELVPLDHGAHGTVEDENALGEQFAKQESAIWLQGIWSLKMKNPER